QPSNGLLLAEQGAALVSLGFLSFLGVFNPNAWKCQNDSYVYMAETFQGKQINQSMSVAERREAALEITPRRERENEKFSGSEAIGKPDGSLIDLLFFYFCANCGSISSDCRIDNAIIHLHSSKHGASRHMPTNLWQPGVSGNPAGRLRGSRNRLSEAVICALLRDFSMHGEKAIAKVRRTQPAAYLKILALLVPREHKVEHSNEIKDMTDEQIERPRSSRRYWRSARQPRMPR